MTITDILESRDAATPLELTPHDRFYFANSEQSRALRHGESADFWATYCAGGEL